MCFSQFSEKLTEAFLTLEAIECTKKPVFKKKKKEEDIVSIGLDFRHPNRKDRIMAEVRHSTQL